MQVREQEMILNLGPQHPSTHGVFRMVVKVDGETITDVVPHMGYLHRGFEKLGERRNYVQYLPYPDRWDYLGAMSNEAAYVGAVEGLMGIEVPRRAQILRVLVQELGRVSSHVFWYGTYVLDVGGMSPFLYAFREREMIMELLNEISGARMTYNYFRIGGVARDATPEWVAHVRDFLPYMRKMVREYEGLLTENEIFLARTQGIGKLSMEDCLDLGVSGPMLRASGLDWDLRKHRPYSIYPELDFVVPVTSGGDLYDRYLIRMQEVHQSLRIIEQCLDLMEDGPIVAKVPRSIKPPAGDFYYAVESPKGELGVYLVSDGSANAYRLKVRPPTLINLQALRRMMVGHLLADAVAVLGSIDIVLGEVDR